MWPINNTIQYKVDLIVIINDISLKRKPIDSN